LPGLTMTVRTDLTSGFHKMLAHGIYLNRNRA